MRIRDDKHHGNHRSIVEKILKSIRDGVDADELVSAAPAIRAAWKSPEREKLRQGAGQAPAPPALPPAGKFNPNIPFGGMAYRASKARRHHSLRAVRLVSSVDEARNHATANLRPVIL